MENDVDAGGLRSFDVGGAEICLGQLAQESRVFGCIVLVPGEYFKIVETDVVQFLGFICVQDEGAIWDVDLDVGVCCDRARDVEFKRIGVRHLSNGDAEEDEEERNHL